MIPLRKEIRIRNDGTPNKGFTGAAGGQVGISYEIATDLGFGYKPDALLISASDVSAPQLGVAPQFVLGNSATGPGSLNAMCVPYGRSVAVNCIGFTHIHCYSAYDGLSFSATDINISPLDSTRGATVLPPLASAVSRALGIATTPDVIELPRMLNGLFPQEYLISCNGPDYGDGVCLKFTVDDADATSNTLMTIIPTLGVLRVSRGSYTHIRYDKPIGKTNNTFFSVGALEV